MNMIARILINEGVLHGSHKNAAHKSPSARFQWWSSKVVTEARKMHPDYAERVTLAYMLEAVADLDDFYQRYIAELDAKD